MTDHVTLVLPWPGPELSPNGRSHWSHLHRAKKAYRRSCWLAVREQLPRWWDDGCRVIVDLTFVRPDRRVHDKDNLVARMKAGLDGLADALGIDDQRFDLGEVVVAEEVESRGLVRLRLRKNNAG